MKNKLVLYFFIFTACLGGVALGCFFLSFLGESVEVAQAGTIFEIHFYDEGILKSRSDIYTDKGIFHINDTVPFMKGERLERHWTRTGVVYLCVVDSEVCKVLD